MRGLERHEKFQDSPDFPHVLIAEARGKAEAMELEDSLLHEHRLAVSTH
jgi:hypothetical protein